jgi:PAS domain-containing protein
MRGKEATRSDPRMMPRLMLLGLLIVSCSVFYYFGETVTYFGWDSLRWDIFYTVHDIHRLLFLAPILYAAYAFGLKATVIISLVVGGIWMPRALFFSPYSFPLLRALLSLAVEATMGVLAATTLRQYRRTARLEMQLSTDRDSMLNVLDGMTDGVLVIGPDYRVRFANGAMRRQFGRAEGLHCYRYIFHYLEPCGETCRLQHVIAGATGRWEYRFPDGMIYEVAASPYTDVDGVKCQLAVYHDITHLRKLPGADEKALSGTTTTDADGLRQATLRGWR